MNLGYDAWLGFMTRANPELNLIFKFFSDRSPMYVATTKKKIPYVSYPLV